MSLCVPFEKKARWTIQAIASLILSLALQPSHSCGQQFGVPIQLPTTSGFSVNTTVGVPDGGSISLGGNSGSAWSSTRSGGPFRPFGNRAIGGSQFASNASVHVQIISLAEMEAELLSQLPGDRGLEDYARPQTPELTIRQAANSASVQKVRPNPLSNRSTSQAESPDNGEANSAMRSSRQASDSKSAPPSKSRFTTEVIDPNGSKQVQEKADFMSRHIGRKKK